MSELRIVRTESGLLSGTGDAIRVFKSIPFAAPPVGERRWRPPEPVEAWQGVRDATAFGADCPQEMRPGSRAGRTDEDCLTLNVWTPARAAGEALPVMVWFYGGSFLFGSASDIRFDGEAFARKDVVLVTANYRVGLFGYLAHPDLSRESPHGASGNYGLLDQIAALAWVQRNIAAFGGDPTRVTAFGVSAGSASIAMLLTSPLAAGLFQRAILESPGAFRPLASLAEAEQAGTTLGPDIAALRQMSAAEILARTNLLVPKVRGLTTPRVLRPIRDGWVMREDERDAFAAGRFHAMPLIVGGNADEGATLTATWPMRTPADLQALAAENFPRALDAAAALYPAARDDEVRGRVAEMFADTQFNYGIWQSARGMSGRVPQTWRYLFLRRRAGRPRWPESRRGSLLRPSTRWPWRLRVRRHRPSTASMQPSPTRCNPPGCASPHQVIPMAEPCRRGRPTASTTTSISNSPTRSASARTGAARRWIFSSAIRRCRQRHRLKEA